MPVRSLARHAGILAVCLAAAAVANAQDARCTDPAFVGTGQVGGDACQKVVDIYAYLNGQLGTLVAGGNATLGQSSALGGLGHVVVTVRANAMRASVPDIEQVGVGLSPVGAPQPIPSDDHVVPFPTVDVAFGLFKGFPVGVTTVGGVDVLASATLLPELELGSANVTTPNGAIKLGVGARVSLLQESLITPGVSLTYVRRDLPTMRITVTAGDTRSVTLQDYEVTTSAWRLVAGKHFPVVGVAAGIGQDRYEGRATLTYDVDGTTPDAPIILDATPTRTNAFVDLSADILVLTVVGEIGRVWGGDVVTYNTFDPVAGDARWYGSVGVRVGR